MTDQTTPEFIIAHDKFGRMIHDGECIIVEAVASREPLGMGYGSTLEPGQVTRAAALEYARTVIGERIAVTLGEYLGRIVVGGQTLRRWAVNAPATHPDDLDALMGVSESPVHVLPGRVVIRAAGVYSPDLYHVDGAPAGEDVEGIPDGWALMSGYTGQYSYSGPVMHASEFIGGRMADDILDEPGIYATSAVECYPEDEDDEPEPAGWAVARRLDA